ncbi:MAG: TVP38/TMEM64 family protein, partial [Paenibacillus sp.]
AFIGHDWQGFIHHPWRILIAAAALFLLWLGGKKLEAHYQL